MTWLGVIALALAALGLGATAFGAARRGWASMAAALALGLAGYAMQASPGLPGAPATGVHQAEQIDWNSIEARKEMVSDAGRAPSNGVMMADGYSRQRRHAEAAAILRHALAQNPRDAEAWLALGNALVEHAGGALTPPALVAYRRAEQVAPESVGPGYFLGLALIRQGRLAEAREAWRSTLGSAAEDAAGRALLADRLARLDELLANPGLLPQPGGS